MAGVCDSLAGVLMPRSQVIRQRVGCVGGVLIAIGVVGWLVECCGGVRLTGCSSTARGASAGVEAVICWVGRG